MKCKQRKKTHTEKMKLKLQEIEKRVGDYERLFGIYLRRWYPEVFGMEVGHDVHMGIAEERTERDGIKQEGIKHEGLQERNLNVKNLTKIKEEGIKEEGIKKAEIQEEGMIQRAIKQEEPKDEVEQGIKLETADEMWY